MSNRSLADRRFTDETRLIVAQIPQRALSRGLFQLDDTSVPALALWTLIRWERKVGLAALEKMHVDLDGLAHKLDELLSQKAEENPPRRSKDGRTIIWDSSGPLEPLLDQAEIEARTLQHNYVGSEHLLLAIITKAETQLSSILDAHLISYETAQKTILELLAA